MKQTNNIFQVNENMMRAQERDAVNRMRFYFRRTLTTCDSPPNVVKACGSSSSSTYSGCCSENSSCTSSTNTADRPPSDDIIEMTLDEIVNGKMPHFPGLAPLIHQYLDSAEVNLKCICT